MKLTQAQKHHNLDPNNQLSLSKHSNNEKSKAAKGERLPYNLQPTLKRRSLLIIFKSFKRSHIDYEDVIYDKL